MSANTQIQEDFFAERSRILDALSEPENRKVIMRLIGALAFRSHCPRFGHIQDALGRAFTDIDFASYSRFSRDIPRILCGLGYDEDKMVSRLFGDTRMLFHDSQHGRHIDVFFDALDFCHILPLKGRLEVEAQTLPLAELLVEKMQIVQLNEKDVVDVIMLLREHEIGTVDDETVNALRICALTAADWGLWRTVTGNLDKVVRKIVDYPQLSDEDTRVVKARIHELQQQIHRYPKPLKWRARNTVGDRVKWYKDVEELQDR